MTDAWMPGAERLPAAADGGRLKGGAPRAVWLVLYADPLTVSARDAAERLIELGRPCHLVWNPLSGDVAQLIPVVRGAGRSAGPRARAGRTAGLAGRPGLGGRPGLAGRARLGPGHGPGLGPGGLGGRADRALRPGRSGRR